MTRTLTWLTCAATCLLANSARADRYIVQLEGAPAADAYQRTGLDAAIDQLAHAHGAHVEHRFGAALRGFTAEMTPAQAASLANDPSVESVSIDALVRADGAVQSGATWGLDRIDQAALPLDMKYAQLGDGAGTTVYVLDSGIRATHGDFTGRVLPGAYAVQDGQGVNDCYFHGTHVAGTVLGTQYGVAKKAQVVPVRVLDCTGNGTVTGIISGIDWIIANKRPNAIANMSLGVAGGNDALDTAVRNLIAAGVTTVVSAGNNAVDACTQSPSRVAEAITVGATTTSDGRWPQSNFGNCVDIFAPGDLVVSASNVVDNGTKVASGTSMASPHVAGVAAAYLSANPGKTPVQIAVALYTGALANKVTDARSTKNLLVNTRFLDSVAPIGEITSPANGATVGSAFTITASASDSNLANVEFLLDGDKVGSAATAPFEASVTNASAGKHELTVIVSDLAGNQTSTSIDITVSATGNPPPGSSGGNDDENEAPETLTAGCSAGIGSTALPFALSLFVVLALRRRRRVGIACAALLVACTVGDESVVWVDTDGDGVADGVDTNGDGERDYSHPSCTTCQTGEKPVCTKPIVDQNNDGIPEGLDLDCDGDIDIPFDFGGNTGGSGGTTTTTGSSRCVAIVSINGTKKEVSCTSTNGGPSTCSCKLNDALVKTCTTTAKPACSIGPSTSNCCGF